MLSQSAEKGERIGLYLCNPTLELHWLNSSDWEVVEGVEDAIRTNPEIASDRKTYLQRKLVMWREQRVSERSSLGIVRQE